IEEAEEINRRAREQAGPPVGGQLQPAPGPTGGVGEGTEPGEGEPRAEAGEGGGQEGDTPSSGDPSGLDGAGDEPEFQQVQLSADGDAEVSDLLDDEEMANRINESLQAEFEVLKELGSTPPPEPVEVTHQDVARLRAHELRNFTVIEQNLARGSLVRAIGPVFGEGPVFVKDTISLPPGPGEDGPREIETWSLTSEGQLNRAPGITVLDEDKIPVSLAMGAEGGLFWVLEASDPAVLLFLPSFDYTRAKHEPVDQVTFENFGRVNPDGRSVAVTTKGNTVPWYLFAIAITFGVLMAYVIELLTDYFVSFKKKPVREVAAASTAGPAPMIIQGFAYGMESSVWAVVAIVVALLAPLFIFPPGEYGGFILSFYGIALVGLGLLTTTGFILAMDTFGPISDNAQGVYEMSGAAKDEKTEEGSMPGSRAVQQLDAAGNTTKALTKGFAIATAVVAAVALYHSYIGDTKLTGIGLPLDLPQIFLGLLIGGAAPFLFCAFMVNAVGRGSFELIGEVRRQFKADPGIMAGTSKPDYAKCVEIVTGHAQKELLGPAILAIALPALVAFGLAIGHEPVIIRGVAYNLTGAQALGGFLAGAILSSQLLAVTLFNSGGIWDNAKKTIEDGMYGGKGSEAHKAGVVVDTVGDPFKDTAGPALNPLIKVMNLVALLMAPVVILDISDTVRYVIVACSVAALAVAVIWSKRGSLGAELQKTAGGE
ncbi:MAG: sodium/proton-translocating pyrophosphatase, partial [Armatimonadetes bacterium]|nr:sodium/proton-translocating pyrophosphatase [Armatimonadota bacterium]